MNLIESIKQTIVTAMKAQQKERVKILRTISASLKQFSIDNKTDLTDSNVIQVLDKQVKLRREAYAQYKSAGRTDLAEKELAEIEIISEFLPKPLSETELLAIINEAVNQTKATSIKDMGKVMGIVKPQVQGRYDMASVSTHIKSLIG